MTLRRTALERKKPLTRRRNSAIRTLRPDEPVPDWEPRRYTTSQGYIKLRWKVGTESYVEEYEHRIIMGRPLDDVHHINGIKADNRPENLVVLSKREHTLLHEQQAKENDPLRGVSRRALAAEARRAQRRERVEAMRADYRAGMSTTQIAEKFGVHHSNVSRALRGAGARMRPPAGANVLQRSSQTVKTRAHMKCERCGALTTWTGGHVHHRQPRGMGGSTLAEIHSPANLVLLCVACHAHVESHREEAYAAGWLVRRPIDPATVPVAIFGRPHLTLLTADGEYEEAAA